MPLNGGPLRHHFDLRRLALLGDGARGHLLVLGVDLADGLFHGFIVGGLAVLAFGQLEQVQAELGGDSGIRGALILGTLAL